MYQKLQKSRNNLATSSIHQSKLNLNEIDRESNTNSSLRVKNSPIKEMSESQEIKLLNLDFLYRTKVPVCLHNLRCSALDWLLLQLYPGDMIGMLINLFFLLYA